MLLTSLKRPDINLQCIVYKIVPELFKSITIYILKIKIKDIIFLNRRNEKEEAILFNSPKGS